ncbi:MAG: hypothetical protein GVY22_01785 [Gammaproteobacteria bacterium]|nr:hypothetical protein [Gammaproteobacteria bacterium]
MASLAAAYQRELDDYDEAQAAADKALWLADTLQDLEDAGWTLEHLETRRTFDRYTIGCDISFWACPDCGSVDADPDEGCEACGYATADEEVAE